MPPISDFGIEANVGGTILYIDDEPQLPAGFEDELQKAGFQLVFADDPEVASRLVRVDDPDLVLMEVVLSSCDGIDLLEAIRSFGGWPAQVPIIVVTKGQRTPELYGRALEADVKEFFTKPVLKSQLLDSVRKFAGVALSAQRIDQIVNLARTHLKRPVVKSPVRACQYTNF